MEHQVEEPSSKSLNINTLLVIIRLETCSEGNKMILVLASDQFRDKENSLQRRPMLFFIEHRLAVLIGVTQFLVDRPYPYCLRQFGTLQFYC